MKMLLIILLLTVILWITQTKLAWATRDEWQGPVVQTCSFYGIWNEKLHVRIVLSQNCMPI